MERAVMRNPILFLTAMTLPASPAAAEDWRLAGGTVMEDQKNVAITFIDWSSITRRGNKVSFMTDNRFKNQIVRRNVGLSMNRLVVLVDADCVAMTYLNKVQWAYLGSSLKFKGGETAVKVARSDEPIHRDIDAVCRNAPLKSVPDRDSAAQIIFANM